MGWLLLIVGGAVFLFGLVQWARGGAGIWAILKYRREKYRLSASERLREEEEIRKIETLTDSALKASFKLLGFVAAAMWIFLGLTLIFDLMGVDWMSRISSRARYYWNSPTYVASPVGKKHSTPQRNAIIQSLGEGVRK